MPTGEGMTEGLAAVAVPRFTLGLQAFGSWVQWRWSVVLASWSCGLLVRSGGWSGFLQQTYLDDAILSAR